jgi:hypothetical protein
MCVALLVPLLVAGGCGGENPMVPMCEVRTSLIDHHAWTQVPVESDPFAAEGTRCGDDRMRAEDLGGELSYTVETRGCRWGTVEQAVPMDIAAGETLNVRLWYFSQTNFDVAEASLLVALEDQPIWTRLVPLPAATGGLVFSSDPAPRAIRAGETVRFHVENHGTNSWNLIELTVSRMEPCSQDGGS